MSEVITNNLDLWTSALLTKSSAGRGSNGKQEAYGINKLRELILELAVRGKLVPQNPDAEPASVLLEIITKEKARLIKEGSIAKQKQLPEIADGEVTFQLPQGWEYVRNGSLFSLRKGKKPKNISESDIGLPYLDIEALDRGNVLRYTDDDKCPRATDEDILVVCDGSRSGLVLDGRNGIIGSTLAVIDTTKMIQPYIKLLFMESYERLNSTMKGAAIPHLDTNRLILDVVGLPPLEEQHRIISKVDELMALCDQLEQQQTHSIEAHQTLVEALLGTLTRVASQQELTEAWTRIANHFDTLFTTEHSIDQLKQTILQLAVMGKLVPQDPSDEDVQLLLTRNDQRRCEVAEGDRRADAEPQPILSADDRWEIPLAWTWRGLADLVLFVDYRGKTPAKQSSGIRLLTAKNVRKGQIELSPEEFLSEEDYAEWMTRGLPKPDDVLFTTEAPMGNAAVVDLNERFALAQRVICFQGYGALDPAFLVLQILSSQFQSILDKNGTGMTAKGIKASKLKQLPVAIPPLAEQYRIVAKVDELIALCDALKARIKDAQTTQNHLADAIVEQAVA